MKNLPIIFFFGLLAGRQCYADEYLQSPPAFVLAFENKAKEILEAAKDKDWWGYYEMLRLSLNVITRSAPEVGQYYIKNPDRLLALQADALNVVCNMMDKTYCVDATPLEDQQLLFNGNVHMALLKKQRLHPETLSAAEKAQLKFMREKELSNFYQAYLALCRRTIRTSCTNAVTLSQLKTFITNSSINVSVRTAAFSINAVSDTLHIR